MKGKLKKCTALSLAAVMTAAAFTGCAKPSISAEDPETEDTPLISASAVSFSNKGSYKTTVTSDSIDLSEIGAEDVTIRYNVIDKNGYKKAVEKAEKDAKEKAIGKAFEKLLSQDSDESKKDEKEENEESSDGEETEAIELDVQPEKVNVDTAKFIEVKKAKVTGVKANGDKLELSFQDSDAAENLTGYYDIELKGGDFDNASSQVEVEFKDYKLTPNIKYVASNDKDIRLTLQLNEGSFADKVEKDDITLSGSFGKMEIKSISSAGKNLTMQLSGAPEIPEGMSAYVDGIVDVSPYAIKDAGTGVRVCIPIELANSYLIPSTLKMNGDKVNVSAELVGVSNDLGKLKPNDFKFEKDVTVTDVKKDSDKQVTLTMTVNGAKDVNSAADVLDGQKLKIADGYEINVAMCEANFYPVFDYVEKSGSDFKFTVNAYVDGGTVSDSIKPSQIVLGGDFAKGKVESVEKDSDTTAKLTFTVPANGQTVETLNMDGEITMKAGALTSQWEKPTSSDSTYLRNYSQESMGRTGTPFEGASLEFYQKMNRWVYSFLNFAKNYTNTKDISAKNFITKFMIETNNELERLQQCMYVTARTAYIASIAGFAMSSVMLGMVSLQFCADMGLFGKDKQLVDAIKETDKRVTMLKDAVTQEYAKLEGLMANNLQDCVTEFNVYLNQLDQNTEKFSQYCKKEYLEDLDVEVPDDFKWEDLLDRKANDKKEVPVNMSIALENSGKDEEPGFEFYKQDFDELDETFINVCNMLLEKSKVDPITALDQSYKYADNFDTSSYFARVAFRARIQNSLYEALSRIRLYKLASYDFQKNDDGSLKTITNDDGTVDYILNSEPPMVEEQLYEQVLVRLSENLELYKYEKADVSEWNNPLFSNEKEYMRISDKKTETYTYPADSAYAEAWAEHEGKKVPEEVTVTYSVDNDVVPYCYTLNTYIRKIDDEYADSSNASIANEMFKEQAGEFTEDDISMFYAKIHGGKTLLQELMGAGVYIDKSVAENTSDGSNGLALGWRTVKENYAVLPAGYSYDTRSKVYYWDSKKFDRTTRDDGKVDKKNDKKNECRFDAIVWNENHNSIDNRPGVIYT